MNPETSSSDIPAELEVVEHENRLDMSQRSWTRAAFGPSGWLQTPFALLIVSSVFLPVLVLGHATYMDRLAREALLAKEAELRTTRIDKLDTEISFRYSKAMRYLIVAGHLNIPPDAMRAALGQAISQLTENPAGDKVQTLYPEFEKMNIFGLLNELRDQLVSAGFTVERQNNAGTVQYVVLQLSKLDDDVRLGKVNVNTAAMRLKTAMTLAPIGQRPEIGASRWNKGFPQTDCKPDEIFC